MTPILDSGETSSTLFNGTFQYPPTRKLSAPLLVDVLLSVTSLDASIYETVLQHRGHGQLEVCHVDLRVAGAEISRAIEAGMFGDHGKVEFH